MQLRLYDMISSTCHLTQCLSGPLFILEKHKLLHHRVSILSRSCATVLSKVMEGSEDLAHRHSQANRLFPPLITIDDDDVHKSISIFANMLFCYSATAVFVLRLLVVLFHETGSGLYSHSSCWMTMLRQWWQSLNIFGKDSKSFYRPVSEPFRQLP